LWRGLKKLDVRDGKQRDWSEYHLLHPFAKPTQRLPPPPPPVRRLTRWPEILVVGDRREDMKRTDLVPGTILKP
jgi:hypothetical protein